MGNETDRRRLPQQARSAGRVDAILEAARLLLQELDLSEVSPRTVASRAGVSPATVYRYFADFDELVDALLVEHSQMAERTVAEALQKSRHRTISGVFELIASAYIDLYTYHPELAIGWKSAALADRQGVIEERSDRSLAIIMGKHLVQRKLVPAFSADDQALLHAQWTTAGTLMGIIIRSEEPARTALIRELLALVHHFATRYQPAAKKRL